MGLLTCIAQPLSARDGSSDVHRAVRDGASRHRTHILRLRGAGEKTHLHLPDAHAGNEHVAVPWLCCRCAIISLSQYHDFAVAAP